MVFEPNLLDSADKFAKMSRNELESFGELARQFPELEKIVKENCKILKEKSRIWEGIVEETFLDFFEMVRLPKLKMLGNFSHTEEYLI